MTWFDPGWRFWIRAGGTNGPGCHADAMFGQSMLSPSTTDWGGVPLLLGEVMTTADCRVTTAQDCSQIECRGTSMVKTF
jgi:hypothetical protein